MVRIGKQRQLLILMFVWLSAECPMKNRAIPLQSSLGGQVTTAIYFAKVSSCYKAKKFLVLRCIGVWVGRKLTEVICGDTDHGSSRRLFKQLLALAFASTQVIRGLFNFILIEASRDL
jgi:hypothetical protein